MHCLPTLLLALSPVQEPAWALAPIEYGTRPSSDRVYELAARLEAGERPFADRGPASTIETLLELLEIPPSSQTTVFTKTSFQARRISPRRPRALYFNDDVYVGYVPGSSVIEITAVDGNEGLVFYTLDEGEHGPRIERETHRCLQCHAPARSGGLPTHLLRSLHPTPDGQPRLRAGSTHVDHATPLEERWGGWYVTGDVGEMAHLGNQVLADGQERLSPSAGQHPSLADLCDVAPYLADTSDIVALLVLEHQTHAQNALVWAGYEARRALHYQGALNEALGEPLGMPVASTETRLDAAAKRVVDALLFVDEAALPNAIGDGSTFAHEFQAGARRDGEGRSLRDLDLETRLFRYPLSYVIDSVAFTGLPEPLRERVWQRLGRVLRGELDDAVAPAATSEDRAAVLEILAATRRSALPADW